MLRRYYNDLWEYDIEELRWRSVSPSSAARPSPRGGSQVAVAGRFQSFRDLSDVALACAGCLHALPIAGPCLLKLQAKPRCF